jgi:hypothetical protein
MLFLSSNYHWKQNTSLPSVFFLLGCHNLYCLDPPVLSNFDFWHTLDVLLENYVSKCIVTHKKLL